MVYRKTNPRMSGHGHSFVKRMSIPTGLSTRDSATFPNSRAESKIGSTPLRRAYFKMLASNCAIRHHIYWRESRMSATSVQFTVGTHIMAVLGFFRDKEIPSASLAQSVNADPSFVRKSLAKLSKAGLVVTTRGKNGASTLARSPQQITLLDIYRASAAPPPFAIHNYPVDKRCPISRNIKGCLSSVLGRTQTSFEDTLDRITLADVVGEIRRASQ
jgi:Rrf2 family protein